MNITAPLRSMSAAQAVEHFDVLIVGAGISGVGSAYHLTKQLPGTTFVVLEEQETFGGTWWTHKYPGIRSDSDLHTFGYSFKPWVGPPIATADEIRAYMGEVIDENGLARHIRYRHRINAASWSSETRLWTIEAVDRESGDNRTFTANFLWMCQGYYRHSEGYTPEWKGMEDYKGQLVHPQRWPEGLETEEALECFACVHRFDECHLLSSCSTEAEGRLVPGSLRASAAASSRRSRSR